MGPLTLPGSSIVGTHLPGIERITSRHNWDTWKFSVQTFLDLEELWCVVKLKKDNGAYETVSADKDRKARAKIWMKLEQAFEDLGLTRRVADLS